MCEMGQPLPCREDRYWRRSFVHKQHPVTDKEQVESLSGRWRLPFTLGSRDIDASVACSNFAAFAATAFIPSEPNVAVRR